MKRKQIYEGRVTDKLTFGGKARVIVENSDTPEDNGNVVSVKNVIPGQKISFRLKRQEKGDLVEVIEKSSLETEKVCPVFGECGGCVYLSMEHSAQLSMKLKMVRELFAEGDICREKLIKIYPSPQTLAYRNKMEFSFGDMQKGGELTLGLHRRSSRHDVITTDACLLVHNDCNEIVKRTLEFLRETGVPYYHKREGKGWLRHLVIRRSEALGELLVTLVTTSQDVDFDASQILYDYVNVITAPGLEGKIAGVLHTVNDCLSDTVKDEGTNILYGRDFLTEEICGLKFKISPFSFFQTNSLGAEVLYGVARDYSMSGMPGDKKPVIFDLYSGTGTIAQIMAPVAKKVYGVEIVEEAVEAAKENARLNGLDNCEFITGDVLKCIDEINERPDFIILDPPRDGVHPKALEKILDYGVENILYISCKPTSLVRDIAVCRERGYEVREISCVDMFPGTGHVETVVSLFQPPKNRETIKVDVDVSSMEPTITETQHLATYEEIKRYCQKVHGLKVSTLFISQVKHFHGLEMRRNYNTSKNSEYKRPKCPANKFHAIEDALRHFKMI